MVVRHKDLFALCAHLFFDRDNVARVVSMELTMQFASFDILY